MASKKDKKKTRFPPAGWVPRFEVSIFYLLKNRKCYILNSFCLFCFPRGIGSGVGGAASLGPGGRAGRRASERTGVRADGRTSGLQRQSPWRRRGLLQTGCRRRRRRRRRGSSTAHHDVHQCRPNDCVYDFFRFNSCDHYFS